MICYIPPPPPLPKRRIPMSNPQSGIIHKMGPTKLEVNYEGHTYTLEDVFNSLSGLDENINKTCDRITMIFAYDPDIKKKVNIFKKELVKDSDKYEYIPDKDEELDEVLDVNIGPRRIKIVLTIVLTGLIIFAIIFGGLLIVTDTTPQADPPVITEQLNPL